MAIKIINKTNAQEFSVLHAEDIVIHEQLVFLDCDYGNIVQLKDLSPEKRYISLKMDCIIDSRNNRVIAVYKTEWFAETVHRLMMHLLQNCGCDEVLVEDDSDYYLNIGNDRVLELYKGGYDL